MEVVTTAEQLFFVTLRVAGRSAEGDRWTGTGFIYAIPTVAGGQAHFLITNRHVLADASQVDLQFMSATADRKPDYGNAHHASIGLGGESWVGHPDEAVDVAAIPLGGVLNQMTADGGQLPFFRSLSPEHLLRPEGVGQYDALEEVTLIGYPNGLIDTHNLIPVARRGATATPIAIDYEGDPAFLIDAAVFEGSSGSPVFILPSAGYTARDGNFVVGGRSLVCLGVLASGPVGERVGEVIELQHEPQRVAVMRELLGLGKVFKAWTIDEAIDPLLAKHGARQCRRRTRRWPRARSSAEPGYLAD